MILNKLVPVLWIFLAFHSVQAQKSNKMPADWEAQEALWLNWPADTAMQKVIMKVVSGCNGKIPVNISFASDSLRDHALVAFAADSISTTGLKLHTNKNATGFFRDTGPWYIFSGSGKPALAKFNLNYFGVSSDHNGSVYGPDSVSMNTLADELAKKSGLPLIKSDIVFENSMITVNSKGVGICFIETLLQRNPRHDLITLTNELKRVLGLKKIIWLGAAPLNEKISRSMKTSNLFGYGGNGHIESYVRFANDTTILVAQIDTFEMRFDPVTSGDFSVLRQNLDYLRKATDEKENPFHIIELPVPAMRYYMATDTVPQDPDSIRFAGMEPGYIYYQVPRVSYIDYLLCNDQVFLPEYFDARLTDSERQKDIIAGKILEALYPNKQIIRVNPVALNLKGGGLRRAVVGQPKGTSQPKSK